ncbi:glycosyltransferase family 2 protein [bacterium]|nr:glycosyltransferase family 2 protein [candidate division CSSED10-310 bacterium]
MNEKPADISIITISTNEGDQLADSIRSVRAGSEGLTVEYFVIDNGSTDSTSDVLNQYQDIHVIRQRTRIGFATNNNLAILRSTGRYVLLLNPDTIMDPDTLPFMVHYMDGHTDIGAASCKLVNPDGSIQHTARRFPTAGAIIARWAHLDRLYPGMRLLRNYLMSDWDHETERDVDWLVGAFIMVRREVIEQVGPLDPAFDPLYYEDIDWCYRIRKNGWRIRYVPYVKTVHLYDRESAQTLFNRWTLIHFRNILRYFWKHRGGR